MGKGSQKEGKQEGKQEGKKQRRMKKNQVRKGRRPESLAKFAPLKQASAFSSTSAGAVGSTPRLSASCQFRTYNGHLPMQKTV
jgi:hypothetical protein